MDRNLRRFVALTLVTGWFFGAFPSLAHAAPGLAPGRVTGQVVGPLGATPAGFEVLLLDESWDLVARTRAGAHGSYEFADVSPGRYRMGISDAQGRLAPVVGPPAEVGPGGTAVVRIDVAKAEAGVRLAPAGYGPSANSWWDRQTRNQKIFWIAATAVGTGVVVWGVMELLDDDETPASPYSK